MHEQLKNIPFELKSLTDDGDFVGIASVYGNVDLGNDVVDAGAFDESIKESDYKVRLMSNHKIAIGVATVRSTRQGLEATGKINKKKQSGAEAISDLKFYQENGLPMGMSIGYETIDADPPHKTKDGARHLKKVRLWEVTITEFPMNISAQVTSVKSIRDIIESIKASRSELKDDFAAELQAIQLYAARWQMSSALDSALASIIRTSEISDKVAASSESIDQFKSAYLTMLPDYLSLLNEEQMQWMSRAITEVKAGRVLSASNRQLVERCVKDLQALLDASDPEKTQAAPEAKSVEAPTGDPGQPEDADRHSADEVAIAEMLGKVEAALSA